MKRKRKYFGLHTWSSVYVRLHILFLILILYRQLKLASNIDSTFYLIASVNNYLNLGQTKLPINLGTLAWPTQSIILAATGVTSQTHKIFCVCMCVCVYIKIYEKAFKDYSWFLSLPFKRIVVVQTSFKHAHARMWFQHDDANGIY